MIGFIAAKKQFKRGILSNATDNCPFSTGFICKVPVHVCFFFSKMIYLRYIYKYLEFRNFLGSGKGGG